MARLEDISEINPRLDSVLGEGDEVSFLGMADVSELGSTSLGTSRTYGEVKKGYTAFADGDLLFAKITPCFENGKIAQALLEHSIGFGSTEFHVVRAYEERADARYLLHLIRGPEVRSAGQRRMTGSGGQQRVPADFLKSIQIPVPPLPEQRRIAAILDQADELRTKRRRTLGLLDELADSVFAEMFGASVTSSAKWPLGHVSDFTEGFQSGKSLASPAEGDASNVDQRILKISSVTTGVFKPNESKPLPFDYQPPAAHSVHAGDLLMSRANTSDLVGACAYVWGEPEGVVLPDKIWRFKWKDTRDVEPLFVRAAISRPEFRRAISGIASGSSGSMKNISQDAFLGLSIIQPNVAAQADFAAEMRRIQELDKSERKQVNVLDELFDSLQHRAFRGEL